jgi:uncharacterized protein YdaU (DUF1376 family)
VTKDCDYPCFPFYVDDFSSDGKVEAMTTEEVGAYMLLLCKAWRERPPGSIPDDDRVLARWARLTPDRWRECRSAVLAAFIAGKDSRWHQKRMRKVYEKMRISAERRSAAGKAGAGRRWSKSGGEREMPIASDCYSNANADAMANDGLSLSSSSSYPLSSSEELILAPDKPAKKKTVEVGDVTLPDGMDTETVKAALADWLAHHRRRRQPYRDPSAVARLFKGHTPQTFVEAVQFSIANNYQGLFSPKGGGGNARPEPGPGQRFTPGSTLGPV